MPFQQSIQGCLDTAIGSHGLSTSELARWLDRLEPGLETLRDEIRSGSRALYRIIGEHADMDAASAAYARLTAGARSVVIFGTGGSSLGAQTIAQLGGWLIPGDAQPGERNRPRLRFFDNLDPRSLQMGLATLAPADTRFIIISKSGGTAETLMQSFAALEWVRQAGLEHEIPNFFLGLTEPAAPGKANGLRALLNHFGIPMLNHDPGIGGRYSALSNVGLIAALARGLEWTALRRGARGVLDAALSATSARDFAPALGAAVAIGLAKERGIRVNVLMPYCDRLNRFAAWYVQLWAESLGKDGEGTTPLAALGPVDQHSQLQLFMDGPHEHLITLIRLTGARKAPPPAPAALAELAGSPYLAGRSAADLVRAQQQAIADALRAAGRPVRTLDVDRLDEAALGALMMHMMMETILAAHLLGVNPFDQPGVELGKKLTRDYLARAPQRISAPDEGAAPELGAAPEEIGGIHPGGTAHGHPPASTIADQPDRSG